jgi:hypothetical protein
MYTFFIDLRDILYSNRKTFYTYFPQEDLIFKGRCLSGKSRSFWFDQELYDLGSHTFAELFAKTDKVDKLAEEFGCEKFIKAKDLISTYFKVYDGLDPDRIVYELIPELLLKEYGQGLFDITEFVLAKREKPKNVRFLAEERSLVEEIASRELRLLEATKGRVQNRILYDMYRGVTGRLNHARGSFPILSLAKEKRGILAPTNDIFVEYDMRSADFRSFLYLFTDNSEKWNDKPDLYEDIPGATRMEKKQKVFSTIYAYQENAFLKRHDVFGKALSRIYHEDDQYVWILNPFDREIRIDKAKGSLEHLIVSYLIQSTTNDITLRKALQVREMLKGTKSHVAFLIHDCFVVDFAREDYEKLGLDIREQIQYSEIGRFFWSEKVGETFGTLVSRGDTHGRDERDRDPGTGTPEPFGDCGAAEDDGSTIAAPEEDDERQDQETP